MPNTHTIVVENCNNITSASISIKENALTIVYGPNGTGKSTIASVIRESTNGNPKYDRFIPYHVRDRGIPSVSGVDFSRVAIFDEDYIKNYTYQKNTLLKDAFEVFVRTPRYDQSKKKVDEALSRIREAFIENIEIVTLITQLDALLSNIKISASGKIDRRSGGPKGLLSGKGGYNNPPHELDEMKPFFADGTVAQWAEWRMNGLEQFGDQGICPYCAQKDNEHTNSITAAFMDNFDKPSITFAANIKKALEGLAGYISDEKAESILSMFGIKDKTCTLESTLTKLAIECRDLRERLLKIRAFNATSVEHSTIGHLAEMLSALKLDPEMFIDYFTGEKTKCVITTINDQIDALLSQVRELQAEIGKSQKYVEDAIKDKQTDINELLSIAGFPYHFRIGIEGEEDARATLYYVPTDGSETPLVAPSDGLSWGERHAFALVMFMFDAIRQNADLIILDDPISSFDSNKKYALMHRLFMTHNRDNSLYQRTVLMLTHDMQPIIDYVQVGGRIMDSSSVTAYYARNDTGTLTLSEIKQDEDILSSVLLMSELANDSSRDMAVRIGCLRKYIEYTVKDPRQNSLAYNILSSIVHGRVDASKDNEGIDLLTNEELAQGKSEIQKYIPDYSYSLLLDECNPEKLLRRYHSLSDAYSKLLVIRIYCERVPEFRETLQRQYEVLRKYIDETFHIENDYVFMLDVRTHNIVPQAIERLADQVIQDELNKLEYI